MIDQEELDRVLINWGGTSTVGAAAAAVPEPASWLLVVVFGAAVLVARRLPMERRDGMGGR
jgi:hypothetical protein